MALWTPAELGAALAAWWDTNALTSLSDGNGIASFTDASGNGNTLTQGNATFQPTYQTNEQNGLPIARFDGSDDRMARGAAGLGAQPFAVFAVWKPAGVNSQRLVLLGGSGPVVGIDAGGDLLLDAGTADTTPITKGAWRMTNCGFNDAASWAAIDGATRVTLSVGTEAATAGGASTILGGFGVWLNADVGEVLLIDGDVVQDTEDLLFGYAAHKWDLANSLPAEHPYKSDAPALDSGASRTGLRYPIGSGLRQRTLR